MVFLQKMLSVFIHVLDDVLIYDLTLVIVLSNTLVTFFTVYFIVKKLKELGMQSYISYVMVLMLVVSILLVVWYLVDQLGDSNNSAFYEFGTIC